MNTKRVRIIRLNTAPNAGRSAVTKTVRPTCGIKRTILNAKRHILNY